MDRIQVMAIDDSPVCREVIALLVGRDTGMDIAASADCAAQAWTALEDHPIDVVTLDLQLPDLDGLALLELLTVKATCGVVVVSADADQHRLALSLGATACFEKAHLLHDHKRFLAAIRRAVPHAPRLRMVY